MFHDNDTIKLEINNKTIIGKVPEVGTKTHNSKSPWVKEEISKKI